MATRCCKPNLITHAASGLRLSWGVFKDPVTVTNLAIAAGYRALTHCALGAANIKELIALARRRMIPIARSGSVTPFTLTPWRRHNARG